jgi:hypothetical protein
MNPLPEELRVARCRAQVLLNKSPEDLDEDDQKEAEQICYTFALFREVSGLSREISDLCKRLR